ncbi:uncharacterized protein SOCE26_085080 [Sorangium cellulosum]|uniref:Uncharacterized protein n=2 Tax=Sorangium cellulosum TaxID=56 RepID=A0A2L0F647_SORCE|nr:uncharacterized protein SOCE26_085080 [Sorangium cellulosum]
MKRHRAGEAVVVPVYIRACDISGAPFDDIKLLPANGTAVKTWPDRDEAWKDVVDGLQSVIKRQQEGPTVAQPTSAPSDFHTSTAATAAAAQLGAPPIPPANRSSRLIEELKLFDLKHLITPTISRLISASTNRELDTELKSIRIYRQSRDARRRSKQKRDMRGPLLERLWRSATAATQMVHVRDAVMYDGYTLRAKKIYFDERLPREDRHIIEHLTTNPDVGIELPQNRYFFARTAPQLTMHPPNCAVESIYRLCWDTAATEESTEESFFDDWWPWSGIKLPDGMWLNFVPPIHFPAVRWRRFIDGERLETSWNEAVASLREFTEKTKNLKIERPWQIESVAHWYITACLLVGMGANVEHAIKIKPSPQDWEQVAELIRCLRKNPGNEPYLRVPMEEFLSRLPKFAEIEEHLSRPAIKALI